MATETNGSGLSGVLENFAGGDVLSVRRVFGEAYEADGVLVIPAARIAGGTGGGGGEGTDSGETGVGFGSGVGLSARPVGVYEVRAGEVAWRPAVDVNRAIRGGQVLVGIIAVCLTLVRLRRQS